MFIPFQYTTPQHQRCPKAIATRYELKQWLRQRRHYQFQTIQEQLKPNFIELQECLLLKWHSFQFIRYRVDDQINYVSDSDLKEKLSKIPLQGQQQQDKETFSPQFCEGKYDFDAPLNKSHNDHRYFNIHKLFCKFCKQRGHVIRNCRKLNRFSVYKAAYTCYFCQKRGHIAKYCKEKRKQKMWQESSDGSPLKLGYWMQVEQKVATDIEY